MRYFATIFLLIGALSAQAQDFFVTHANPAVLVLGGPQNGEYPFLNFIKTCGNINGSTTFPTQLTADSYPTGTLSVGNLVCTISALPSAATLGVAHWVLEWPQQGSTNQTATVQIVSGSATLTTCQSAGCAAACSGSNCPIGTACAVTNNASSHWTLAGTNCRAEFDVTGTQGGFTITFLNGDTYTNFTNLILVRSDQESALLNCSAVACFYPDFLATLSSAQGTAPSGISVNPTIIRFLNWQGINNSNEADSSYGPAATNITYSSAQHYTPSLYAAEICAQSTGSGSCPSGSSTANNYIATCAGSPQCTCPGSLTQGLTIQGYVIDANTSTTPNLAFCGLAATNIVGLNTLAVGDGQIGANSLQTLVYDSVLNEWIVSSGGVISGVPLSVIVALCNALSVGCWVQFPVMVDSATVTSEATYVAENLNAGLTAYFEFSNEIWNFANDQTQLMLAHGNAQGFSSGNNRNVFDPYAFQRFQVMQLVTSAWTEAGRSLAQLRRIEAFQAFGSNTQVENYRLLGEDLTVDASGNYTTGPVGSGCGGAGSGLAVATNYSNATVCNVASAGYPVSTNIDILSYAPYTNGAQIVSCNAASTACYQNTMTSALTAADNYAAGGSSAASALAFIDSDIRTGTRNGSLGCHTLAGYNTTTVSCGTAIFSIWDTLAQKYSTNLSLCAGTACNVYGVIQYEGGFQDTPPTPAALTSLATAGSYTTCASGNATNCAAEFADLINAYRSGGLYQFTLDSFNAFKSYKSSIAPAYFELGPDTTQWPMIGCETTPGTTTCSSNSNLVPDIYTAPYASYNGFSAFVPVR
jgi:hypothetical protein